MEDDEGPWIAASKAWLASARRELDAVVPPDRAGQPLLPRDPVGGWARADCLLKRMETGRGFWRGPTQDRTEHTASVTARTGLLMSMTLHRHLAIATADPDGASSAVGPTAAERILRAAEAGLWIEPIGESRLDTISAPVEPPEGACEEARKDYRRLLKRFERKILADTNAAQAFASLDLAAELMRLDDREGTGQRFCRLLPEAEWHEAQAARDERALRAWGQAWSAAVAMTYEGWLRAKVRGRTPREVFSTLVNGRMAAIQFRLLPTSLKSLSLRFVGDPGLCTMLDPSPEDALFHWKHADASGKSAVRIALHKISTYMAGVTNVYTGRNRNLLILACWLQAMGAEGPAALPAIEGGPMPHTHTEGELPAEIAQQTHASHTSAMARAIARLEGKRAAPPRTLFRPPARNEATTVFDLPARDLKLRMAGDDARADDRRLVDIVIPWHEFGLDPAAWFDLVVAARHQGRWQLVDIEFDDGSDSGRGTDQEPPVEDADDRLTISLAGDAVDRQFVARLRRAIVSGHWAYQSVESGVFAALAVNLDRQFS